MTNGQPIIQSTALTNSTTKPFPPGSNSIYSAGVVEQRNQSQMQTDLVKKSGGSRRSGSRRRTRSRRMRGGQPMVAVQPAPSYAPDKTATNNNNAALTELAQKTQNNAAFDKTTSQSQVATISTQQQNIYNGKGGKKKYRKNGKKGGSWPHWGCLSGGKLTRLTRRKYKKKKSRKTRRYRR
jgi:hypothetical protein